MAKEKTVTLSAQVAISKSENGMDYVQVLPDNPWKGQVRPFVGEGRGQLMDDGSFDFVRRKRIRKKPVLKLPHSSLTFGQDGNDRLYFGMPNGQREEFADCLEKEFHVVVKYMRNKYGKRK